MVRLKNSRRFAVIGTIVISCVLLAGCEEGRGGGGNGPTQAEKRQQQRERQQRIAQRQREAALRAEIQKQKRKKKQAAAAAALAQATPAEELPTAAAPVEESSCDPNYSECLDPNSADYDCVGGTGDGPDYTGIVQVIGSDVYDLDADGDGTACDT